MRDTPPLYAGVETGGTKTLCRLVEGERTLGEWRWPTGAPDALAATLIGAVRAALPEGRVLSAVGLAAFGPLNLDPRSADYGRIGTTPKPGWPGANLRLALAQAFGAPVVVDTDVNAAAVAEQALGAGRGIDALAYVTVGTGIGGGLATAGHTLKGAQHPEIGHFALRRPPGDKQASACPFHADCAEGLTAGPAVMRRLGEAPSPDRRREVLALTADYLGQLLATLVLAWSPERIVLGGGVIGMEGLLEAVRERTAASLGGYGVGDAAHRPDFIVHAALENAGLEGALLMARTHDGAPVG